MQPDRLLNLFAKSENEGKIASTQAGTPKHIVGTAVQWWQTWLFITRFLLAALRASLHIIEHGMQLYVVSVGHGCAQCQLQKIH